MSKGMKPEDGTPATWEGRIQSPCDSKESDVLFEDFLNRV